MASPAPVDWSRRRAMQTWPPFCFARPRNCSPCPTGPGPSEKAPGPPRRASPDSAGPGPADRAPPDPAERNERWLFSALPEWEEDAPRPARAPSTCRPRFGGRLRHLTGEGAEERPAARLCRRRHRRLRPARGARHAQYGAGRGGTGIGKTLGYLAPASLWAERAGGAVWISTYTKALQRQLSGETARIFPMPCCARNASSPARGARIISACSIWRMRCKAGFADARRCWRNWSRAGRPIRRRYGRPGGDLPGPDTCSAATARPR